MNVQRRTALPRFATVDAFLAWEDRQDGKHEFHGGRVIAMTGGTKAHQRIVINVAAALLSRLDPSRFDLIQEMRLRLPGLSVRYPDIVVVPGQVDAETTTLTDAVMIFEVLSPATARADRGEKFESYQRLPSLRGYVLVEQQRAALQVWRRHADGAWSAEPEVTEALRLPEVGVELSLTDIYAGLVLTG